MKIRHKGVYHERFDAPFVGALISSIGCTIGCPGCINEHVKNAPEQVSTVQELMDAVEANPFNQGVILGGLEWTEQPTELLALITEALNRGLKVLLYTGRTESWVKANMPELLGLPIWIKFGEYRAGSSTKSFGVLLASDNQYIKYFGG